MKLKKCKNCKKEKELNEFYYSKINKDNKQTFCIDCYKENQKKYTKPKNSKFFLKTKKNKYGLGTATIYRFGLKLSLEVYDRAGRKCEECGSENDLTIHHIDGKGRHNQENGLEVNNNKNNLRILCRKCHGRLHGKQGGRPRIYK